MTPKPDMRNVDTEAYRLAPSGEGELASQWKDKPHRLIYDLCLAVEQLRKEIEDRKLR